MSPENLDNRQLQQLVDDATEICSVPFTLLSTFNETTKKFEFRVMGGINNPLLKKAIEAGRKIAGFDFFGFSHEPNANPLIESLLGKKQPIVTDIFAVSENILPRPAIEAAQLILSLKKIALFPVIIDDRVKGLMGFLSQREITDPDLKLMRTFVNEMQLLLENALLNAGLENIVRERTAALRESEQQFQFLSRTAEDFLILGLDDNVFEYIIEKIQSLIGPDIIVGVAEYDELNDRMLVREILGINPYLKGIMKILGKDPKEISYKGDEKNRKILLSGRLVDVTDGLAALSTDIPEAVFKALDRLLDFGRLYAIGFSWQEKLFGDVVIVLRRGQELKNKSVIEAFVKQASLAFLRRKAEYALIGSQGVFNSIVEKNTSAIIVADRQGRVLFANSRAETLFGKPRKEFIGQKFAYPLVLDKATEIELPLDRTVEIRTAETDWSGEKAYLITALDISERKKTMTCLNEKIVELEDFRKVTVGRELKMIELEKEIEELKKK